MPDVPTDAGTRMNLLVSSESYHYHYDLVRTQGSVPSRLLGSRKRNMVSRLSLRSFRKIFIIFLKEPTAKIAFMRILISGELGSFA